MEKEAISMPLRYKIDILKALKEKGYNTNVIRTKALFSQSTLQKFRNQQGVSWENLETLCRLLDCQPADLIEFQKEEAIE
jgi:putative transcriptional regulator